MYNKEMSAVVFCGGFGERMQDLTDEANGKQKCMLNVEGDPILVHIVNRLVDAFGSSRVILAVGYKQEQVVNFFHK